jgi:hypothetical protein
MGGALRVFAYAHTCYTHAAEARCAQPIFDAVVARSITPDVEERCSRKFQDVELQRHEGTGHSGGFGGGGETVGSRCGLPQESRGAYGRRRRQRVGGTQDGAHTDRGIGSERTGHGPTLQQPPDRVLVPILNGAGNEDDAELRTKWASLLAHSVTKPDSVLPAYPKILSELSPLEAKILDWLFENSEFRASLDPPNALRTKVHISLDSLISQFAFADSDSALTLCAHLLRLGLVQMSQSNFSQMADGTLEARFVHIVITPFAMKFVMACGSYDLSREGCMRAGIDAMAFRALRGAGGPAPC